MGVKERERLFFLFPSPDVGSTKYVELVPDVEEASCSKNMTPWSGREFFCAVE